MEHKLNTSSLKIGMFVSTLDRPWIDTPFLLEGFNIETEDDIDTLNKFCSFVFIDPSRGIGSDKYIAEKPKLKTNSYLERYLQDNIRKVQYKDTKSSNWVDLENLLIVRVDKNSNEEKLLNTIISSKKTSLKEIEQLAHYGERRFPNCGPDYH